MGEDIFYKVDATVAGSADRWTPEGWAKSQLERITRICAGEPEKKESGK
jgi:hypothetical protein